MAGKRDTDRAETSAFYRAFRPAYRVPDGPR